MDLFRTYSNRNKNSQEEINGRLEMREESASEFEDQSIVMIHSEEQRGKDWSKINSGSGVHMVGIPERKKSETGTERICRVDGSDLSNVVKNTNLRILVYLKVKRNHTIKLPKIKGKRKKWKAARIKNVLHTLGKW